MELTLNLDQFSFTQSKLLYCALDSPQYTTDLLIERSLPGRASPPPNLDQADLNDLVRDGWVTLLSKQIDIEASIAVQLHHQRLIMAIDNPARAELIAAAQPTPPKVVLARIQFQCTDRAILALTPFKEDLKTQFDRSEPPPGKWPMGFSKASIKRIYIMSDSAAGNFSVRVPSNITKPTN